MFKNITFTVNKGDKIAIVSDDQTAVTAFFEIINGEDEPQITATLNGELRFQKPICPMIIPNISQKICLSWTGSGSMFRRHVTDVDEPFLRGFLGKMLFSGDEILKKTGVLSGGEKVRCMISRMMLQDPNVVILDEPTNHLDLESIQAFNESMTNFKGIVLISSHDHTFLQTVANRIIELTPNGAIDKLMTFDEYLESKQPESSGGLSGEGK